jgi:NAD-reducing hydrogenase small subunit
MAAKLKVATVSLAGCFGCHMSFLDIDERLLPLLDLVEFDRSPITDIKHCGPCDIGLIEGGVCNAENVHVLREFRENCKVLIALGACAVNGGLPASATTCKLPTSCKRCTAPGTAWPKAARYRTTLSCPCR